MRFSEEALRVAVGLRLWERICEPHTCACGSFVTARGEPGLPSSLGLGRVARHGWLNYLIYRALIKNGFPAVTESQGFLRRSDGKGRMASLALQEEPLEAWCGTPQWWTNWDRLSLLYQQLGLEQRSAWQTTERTKNTPIAVEKL